MDETAGRRVADTGAAAISRLCFYRHGGAGTALYGAEGGAEILKTAGDWNG